MSMGYAPKHLSKADIDAKIVTAGRISVQTRTLSVAMAALSTNTDVAWGMLMAGIFITLIPSLILAILVWKFVVEGIILGAVKY